MKQHGVTITDPAKINRNDPKLQQALKACRKYMPAGPGRP
jgi:hypothetical protein